MKKRITVHLVIRDRHDSLAILLSSLLRQTYKWWDLIIIDNSEGQKAKDHQLCNFLLKRIEYEGHRVKYFLADPSISDIGTYRNIALKKERETFNNKFGLRIDDDSWCEPNYIELLIKGFKDDEVGIVGGIVPYIRMPKQYALKPKIFNEVTPHFDWIDNCTTFFRTKPNEYFEAGHIRSSFMYRMSMIDKIGGFPEWTSFSGYSEETFFSIKATLHGWKILFNPQAVCWHFAAAHGGGRPKVRDQAHIEEIKWKNTKKLKLELEKLRRKLNEKKKSK